MGILLEYRRPLYRNLELCVGETAPPELFVLTHLRASLEEELLSRIEMAPAPRS
jgi:hypothetical protein